MRSGAGLGALSPSCGRAQGLRCVNAVSCVGFQEGPGNPEDSMTFHQPLKRWLSARNDAATVGALLRTFRHVYTYERPH